MEIVHPLFSSTIAHDAQQPPATEFVSLSSTLDAGYDTPFGQLADADKSNGLVLLHFDPQAFPRRPFSEQARPTLHDTFELHPGGLVHLKPPFNFALNPIIFILSKSHLASPEIALSHLASAHPPLPCTSNITPFSSSESSSRSIKVVHCRSPSGASHDHQQRLVTDITSFSTTLSAGYTAPLGQNGIIQTVISSLKREHRAFSAEPSKTFYLEFPDGGNTQIQVSVGDDVPEDTPTFIGVHGMAGDSEAPYLHEILSFLVKEKRERGVVFNFRGCGESTATSPTFHHGASTSDLGTVVTWVTIRWPKSKVYVIGTSLGAVIAAKMLGQWGEACTVSAAALISPVYDFVASCRAMEANFVSRNVFNPAVGAFYTKLVKENIDAFDIEHWTHTRPTPFQPTATSTPPPLAESVDTSFSQDSRPFTQESRSDSFASSLPSTRATSIFSSLPSPTTPGSSWPGTPSYESSTSCPTLTRPTFSAPIVAEHTPKIRDALANSLTRVTPRILPQSLTSFCKSFVPAPAHFLSGEEFRAATSAVDDLPKIRIPCLAVRKSPFVLMAVLKKGGHLGTFTTKKWKKRNGDKRYHTALVEEWLRANEALPQIRPRPQIVNARQGFVYPQGHPEMAFRETTSIYLKLKLTRPAYRILARQMTRFCHFRRKLKLVLRM